MHGSPSTKGARTGLRLARSRSSQGRSARRCRSASAVPGVVDAGLEGRLAERFEHLGEVGRDAAPLRQPRSSAIASSVNGTWRSSTLPRSRQREQTQTTTSKASAPSGGPASILCPNASWSVASSRHTNSPPPLSVRRPSAKAPSERGWSRRRPGQTPGRASAGDHLGAAGSAACRRLDRGGGRLSRLGLREATLDERSERGVVRRVGLLRPFMAPPGWEQGGNQTGRDDTRCARPIEPRTSSDQGIARRPETDRERPRLLLIPRS